MNSALAPWSSQDKRGATPLQMKEEIVAKLDSQAKNLNMDGLETFPTKAPCSSNAVLDRPLTRPALWA